MRNSKLLYTLSLIFILFIIFIFNFFIFPFTSEFNSYFYLVHLFFYCIIFSMGFTGMLFFAVIIGLSWDLLTSPIINLKQEASSSFIQVFISQPENVIGYSILIFALTGVIFHSFYPLYRSKHWYFILFFIPFALFIHFTIEYVLFLFIRGNTIDGRIYFKNLFQLTIFNCLAIPFLFIFIRYIYNFFHKSTVGMNMGMRRF